MTPARSLTIREQKTYSFLYLEIQIMKEHKGNVFIINSCSHWAKDENLSDCIRKWLEYRAFEYWGVDVEHVTVFYIDNVTMDEVEINHYGSIVRPKGTELRALKCSLDRKLYEKAMKAYNTYEETVDNLDSPIHQVWDAPILKDGETIWKGDK